MWLLALAGTRFSDLRGTLQTCLFLFPPYIYILGYFISKYKLQMSFCAAVKNC